MNSELSASALRQLRRSLQITQGQLADKLGLRQATISRWETGTEPIPLRRRLQLLELLTNTKDALAPPIARLCRRDLNISVVSPTKTYLRVSQNASRAFRLDPSEAHGQPVARWLMQGPANSNRTSVLSPGFVFESEVLYLVAEGDVMRCDPGGPDIRYRVRETTHRVSLGPGEEYFLTRAQVVGAGTGRRGQVHKVVQLSDIDV